MATVPILHIVTMGVLRNHRQLGAMMESVAKVSEAGKMNIPASIRLEDGLEHGGPVMVSVVQGEIRMRVLQQVLAELQAEAQEVFAGSAETVDGFLQQRRDMT